MIFRPRSLPTRPTLRTTLRRAHLSVTLIAVSVVGTILTVMGLAALQAYSDHNLKLIARSMLYTVEASAVFHDSAAAREALSLIAATEDVGAAVVFDGAGQVLAQWHREPSRNFPDLRQQFDRLFNPEPILAPIVHQRQTVGYLLVTGHAGNLLSFLLQGAAGVLACLFVSGTLARGISRRTLADIVQPLHNLARVAHSVRNERAFGVRMPPADIAELNTLGDNFNGLLDELESWQNQMQRENESLAHKAAHDSLTGLPNRAHFEDQLNRAIHDAAILNRRVAVMFLDNDRFKVVNDRLGHAAGDTVLVSVAARVRNQLREGDLVARLGGDEFAIMLSPLRDVKDAQRIADDILISMRAPIRLPNGEDIVGSLSIGIAVFPDHAQDAPALFEAADIAMYQAKRQGGATQAVAQSSQQTLFQTTTQEMNS
jgi:diguanylate cyclase (GGDEF)-like protein